MLLWREMMGVMRTKSTLFSKCGYQESRRLAFGPDFASGVPLTTVQLDLLRSQATLLIVIATMEAHKLRRFRCLWLTSISKGAVQSETIVIHVDLAPEMRR